MVLIKKQSTLILWKPWAGYRWYRSWWLKLEIYRKKSEHQEKNYGRVNPSFIHRLALVALAGSWGARRVIQSEAELVRPWRRGQLRLRGGSADHWVAKVEQRCQSTHIGHIILTLGHIRLSEVCIREFLSFVGIEAFPFQKFIKYALGNSEGNIVGVQTGLNLNLVATQPPEQIK